MNFDSPSQKGQKKFKLRILSHNLSITAKENEILSDKILEAGINLSSYCNKKGLCGKCFVEIVDEKLPPLMEREKIFIKQKKLNENYRLACLYKIKKNLNLRIPQESLIKETFILQTGIKSTLSPNPAVKKYYLHLKKPEISSPLSLLELLELHLKRKNLIIPLNLLRNLQPLLEKSHFRITAVVFDDKEIVNIEPENTSEKNFGIAVDVGTTTLVMELVDLHSGKTVDTISEMNSQVKYGSDVVSRITFAFSDSKKLELLRNSILGSLNRMVRHLLRKNKIDHSFVYEIVIAGNTTMNHFLLGLPIKTLGLAPFHSIFTSLAELSAKDLGLKINEYGKAYFSPNIKSFVGGDISAGLLAVDLANKKGNHLFIDLGTNGEIVLRTNKRIHVTSTAAGPAFEGMNISCGMLAQPGAIYKAEYNHGLNLSTINNSPEAGICGTGLIDLISIFLKQNKISPQGTIIDKAKKIPIVKNIHITQKDVRELQLAIAAMKTGIKLLLQENGLKVKDLDGIFIGGAFGNYLNIKNSMAIGLLPRIDLEKVVFIGNSSIAGAKALLISRPSREKIESLVKKIQYISLATKPLFQECFIKALEFKSKYWDF